MLRLRIVRTALVLGGLLVVSCADSTGPKHIDGRDRLSKPTDRVTTSHLFPRTPPTPKSPWNLGLKKLRTRR